MGTSTVEMDKNTMANATNAIVLNPTSMCVSFGGLMSFHHKLYYLNYYEMKEK